MKARGLIVGGCPCRDGWYDWTTLCSLLVASEVDCLNAAVSCLIANSYQHQLRDSLYVVRASIRLWRQPTLRCMLLGSVCELSSLSRSNRSIRETQTSYVDPRLLRLSPALLTSDAAPSAIIHAIRKEPSPRLCLRASFRRRRILRPTITFPPTPT